MKKLFCFVMLACCSLSSAWAQQQQRQSSGNPIFSGWYADPEGAVLDGRYWVFPTYSAPYDEQLFFDAFSSTDLVHWQKHERVLEQKNIPWLRRALWAPAVIENGGRYYLFFGGNDVHEGEVGGIGVAVADRPEGPYKDALGRPLINEIVNGAQPIDQFVFRDDDGQFYMYYGGWRHCNVCRLSPDLLSIVPWEDGRKFREVTPSESYVEGPFMLKRGGKYYFMWSEGGWTGPDYCVAYAIADSPLGPFRRIGKILQGDPQVAMGAGHHSVIKGPGADEYYIIYHRRPLTETDGNSRETCIDRLRFRADGTIEPVRMTREGVPASPLRRSLTSYANTLLGTATLWTPEDLGFTYLSDKRPWGGETFPGATTPNGMVQLSPVTKYGSGGGYQYEDRNIYGFAHTAMGHWNLLNVPMMPVTKAGFYRADSYASHYSHERETARPGYYQVYLERYGVNAELTVTPRCGYHRYTFRPEDEKRLLVDITRANGRPRRTEVTRAGQRAFRGRQDGVFFYAVTNFDIDEVREERGFGAPVSVVTFKDSEGPTPLEVKVGLSFTSPENARLNLEAELAGKSFQEVRREADGLWETLLGRVRVTGGTEAQKGMLYSTLYRAFLWPSLRSDVNGEYRDERGQTVRDTTFLYYTNPAFWDEARNQLTLLAMLNPQVATDVIKSSIDRGEKQDGYMPTYFHGDHASTFISGTWLRGLHTFDLQRAYKLILKNATVPGRARPYLDEYMQQGWIAEKDTFNVPTWNEYKAAVTKTLEYAYDDYAVALVAHELKDRRNEKLLLQRAKNYRHVYDPETGFMRGRIADGSFIKDFDPYYPYYAYQYREANAWNSLFYAPHDPEGIVALYPSKLAVEQKLDSLFTEPYRDYEADNFSGFIGNYCHGNQPGHTIPFTYYFIGRQEKSQQVIDKILNEYYGRGPEHLALPGMDDGGEMSSWYALTALGIYTYSPADPAYIVSVPLFERVEVDLPHAGKTFTIVRKGEGSRIRRILVGGKPLKGWFVSHADLAAGKELTIEVEAAPDAFSWSSDTER